MKRMLAVVLGGLALVYLGLAALVASKWSASTNERHDAFARARVLAKEHTAKLTRGPELASLEAACEGKLAVQGPYELIGYSLGGTGPVAGDDFLDPDDHLVGFKSPNYKGGDPVTTTASGDIPPYQTSFGRELLGALDPSGWDYKLDPDYTSGGPETRKAKFLAVTRATDIVFPELSDDTYTPGRAHLHTRVLTFPAGEVVCEGESAPFTPKSVQMEGRGSDELEAKGNAETRVAWHVRVYFKDSILWTPLDRLCKAGDAKLCKLTASEARR